MEKSICKMTGQKWWVHVTICVHNSPLKSLVLYYLLFSIKCVFSSFLESQKYKYRTGGLGCMCAFVHSSVHTGVKLRCCVCVITFGSQHSTDWQGVPHARKQENGGVKRLNDSPKVIYLGNDKTDIQTGTYFYIRLFFVAF